MTDQSTVTIDERIERVHALDLEPIAYKLMHPEPGETGASLEEADRLIGFYRQYLILCLRHPEVGIVPTIEIDLVWHAHILDTQKYQADCDHVFGFFLHHFPYLGLRGEQDEQQWREQHTHTLELLHHDFGAGCAAGGSGCTPTYHGVAGSWCCTPFQACQQSLDRPRPVRTASAPVAGPRHG
jgi:hypothetical protein